MNILITGGAGFIGFHTARALLARGHSVVAIDEVNAYYDPALKRARLAAIGTHTGFRFVEDDIARPGALVEAAAGERFDVVLSLAAQAGVRYALTAPFAYTRSNLVGHHNVIDFCHQHEGLAHLVYASSSSVYGNDTVAPFREDARADRPLSYYGATKRAGELLSYSYASLYGLKQTGLRFFTVYGPWGRPDMAYWSFTDAILAGRPIPVFGGGKLRRDFTYIDDIVAALVRIVETPFAGPETDAPHRIYNLGNHRPQTVMELVAAIEAATGKKAIIEQTQGPPGDVNETYADITRASRDFGFAPAVKLEDGIARFVDWFRGHYGC
ncbi:MAG: NAD-dependent epimerase/dehydratase family protein [Pseudomonadota bacterium]|nr:NAD-dependent epimerase/dehydratase family protein [Pseudomonadota bacterium]